MYIFIIHCQTMPKTFNCGKFVPMLFNEFAAPLGINIALLAFHFNVSSFSSYYFTMGLKVLLGDGTWINKGRISRVSCRCLSACPLRTHSNINILSLLVMIIDNNDVLRSFGHICYDTTLV